MRILNFKPLEKRLNFNLIKFIAIWKVWWADLPFCDISFLVFAKVNGGWSGWSAWSGCAAMKNEFATLQEWRWPGIDELLCFCEISVTHARYLWYKTLKVIWCYEAVTEHFSLVYKERTLVTEYRATLDHLVYMCQNRLKKDA